MLTTRSRGKLTSPDDGLAIAARSQWIRCSTTLYPSIASVGFAGVVQALPRT